MYQVSFLEEGYPCQGLLHIRKWLGPTQKIRLFPITLTQTQDSCFWLFIAQAGWLGIVIMSATVKK